MYETSTRLMGGYVTSKYDNGDDIKMILNELKMPTLENPEALDSMADVKHKDIYIEDVKAYAKDNRVLTRSAKKLYSLVIGQFTEILLAKMKGKEDWKKIDYKSNSGELLKMIKEFFFKVDTGKNIYMTTWKVKREIANLLQSNNTPERYL